MKGLLLVIGLSVLTTLATAVPASAHVVEVTTTLDVGETADTKAVQQALRAKLDQILKETVAFKPTLVAITDARVVGERVYVRILLADEAGEAMLKDVDGGGGADAEDDGQAKI